MSEDKELRKCSSCSSTKLLETYFSKNVKGQYYKTCDNCLKGRALYRTNNKERLAGQKKIYCKENKQKVAERNKKWRDQNKTKIVEKNKEYYESNKERLLEQVKIYAEENKQKIAERNKIYYKENKQKKSEQHKKWREQNKDKIAERMKKYQEEKKHHCHHNTSKNICKICNPNGHLKGVVTSIIKYALKTNKSKKSIEYLGCDIQTFKEHIEKSFKENMSWDNYGFGDDKWNVDHICPIMYSEDGNPPSIEEVCERLHYLNTQAMWQLENISKGNRYIGDYQSSNSDADLSSSESSI
jgi:hypothetical protein